MKNCTHCGAENIESNFHCFQCAALMPAGPFPFTLWPRSAAEWTRSLTFALFLTCVITLLFRSWATDRGIWYYLAPTVGWILLPSLGAALLSFCIWGKELPITVRVIGMGVAVFSILVLFMPVRDPLSDVIIKQGWRGIGFCPAPFRR